MMRKQTVQDVEFENFGFGTGTGTNGMLDEFGEAFTGTGSRDIAKELDESGQTFSGTNPRDTEEMMDETRLTFTVTVGGGPKTKENLA